MAIDFFCTFCGRRLQAKDEAAGRRASCARCGKLVQIPRPEPNPAVVAVSPWGELAAEHKTQAKPEYGVTSSTSGLHPPAPPPFPGEVELEGDVDGLPDAGWAYAALPAAILLMLNLEAARIWWSGPTKAVEALAVVLSATLAYLVLRAFLDRWKVTHPVARGTGGVFLGVLCAGAIAAWGLHSPRSPLSFDLPSQIVVFNRDKPGELLMLVFKYGCLYLAGLAFIHDMRLFLSTFNAAAVKRASGKPYHTGKETGSPWAQMLSRLLILNPKVFEPLLHAPFVGSIPGVVVNRNWRLPPSRMPHWLVHHRGGQVDEIANRFLERIHSERANEVGLAVAGEMHNEPDVIRPIRIIHRHGTGHISTTDVVLRGEGQDLYVKFSSRPRTLLTYLRWQVKTFVFLILFFALLCGYLLFTGAKWSWAKEYAAKYANSWYSSEDKSAFLSRKILEGNYTTRWDKFRELLRAKRGLVDAISKNCAAYVNDRRSQLAKDKSKPFSGLPMLGEAMSGEANTLVEVEKLSQLREYAFEDLVFLTLADKTNPDELVAWRCRDEYWPPVMVSLGMPDGFFAAYKDAIAEEQHIQAIESMQYIKSLRATIVSAFDFFDDAPDLKAQILECFDKATSWEEPWTYPRLFLADPRNALVNFSVPASILAMIVGLFAWRIPDTALRFPCRMLGWPTPDDYNTSCVARNGWTIRALSQTLYDMGVNTGEILDLEGQGSA